MMRLTSILIVSAVVITAAACKDSVGQSNPTPVVSQIGVVDLDAVAKALGRDQVIAQKLQSTQEELRGQIESAKNQFQTQIEQKKDEYGEEMSEEEQQQLARMTLQANQRLQQAAAEANRQTTAARMNLIREFRDEAQPFIERIAGEQNLKVVFVKSEAVMYVDPTVEITDRVIELMKAREPQTEPTTDAAIE